MGDKTHPQQFRVPPISYPFLNLLPSPSAEGKRVKAGQLQGQGLARSSTGIAGSRARAGAHTRSGDEFDVIDRSQRSQQCLKTTGGEVSRLSKGVGPPKVTRALRQLVPPEDIPSAGIGHSCASGGACLIQTILHFQFCRSETKNGFFV